jgi:RES domain-containing protein
MASDPWADRWRGITTVSRLASRQYAGDVTVALNGYGGLHLAGRWNRKGQRVVYTASSRALALLERMAHLDAGLHDAGADLVFMEFVIPPAVTRDVISPEMMQQLVDRHSRSGESQDWRIQDHPVCWRVGSAWIAAQRSCMLIVPSSVVSGDANVLINPDHPDLASIVEANAGQFVPDPYKADRRIAEVVRMASFSKVAVS